MNKTLHIGLWVVQALLALAFLGAGFMKLTTPIDELVKAGMTWAQDPLWLARFVGAAEFAGGLGLILPAALRIAPKLTGVAAAALTLVMVLAEVVHVRLGDGVGQMVPAFVLGALSAFVAWGRLKAAPIAPRG